MLEQFKEMWNEGLIPKSAQADSGANFASVFKTGKIGIQGTGGFLLSELKHDVPNMNFGVTFLPGVKEGQVVLLRRRRRRRDPEGLQACRRSPRRSSPGS